MQYTSASFAHPLLMLVAPLLLWRRSRPRFTDYFPAAGQTASTQASDLAVESGYRPSYRALEWLMAHPRWLQSGRVQLYVLYIVLTLLGLLIGYLGN